MNKGKSFSKYPFLVSRVEAYLQHLEAGPSRGKCSSPFGSHRSTLFQCSGGSFMEAQYIHSEPKPTDLPKGFRVCEDRRKITEPPFKQHSRLFQSPRDTVPTPPPAFPRELQSPFPILWFSFL
ncbi:hypothetical protein AVEN_215911-1 [Araneus ventricosus]|uniref:Uncharacterized protein n=1 Tax=Araneus ventricosus TaxID=182803 RepID=A0A4Y2V873_ARAVE|nr:hypothetical protein AVEN_215911-1 [Araneus ventricosus]